ncbi:MAG: 3-keto-5-aminohexanoate cleavage protein [Thermomicrobiales bacterium]
MVQMHDTVVIEAALNGGRSRREHPAVPIMPDEVADEARRCADAGAQVIHIHAQDADGAWSADPAWYRDTLRRIHAIAPGVLISITSIRPANQPIAVILDLLTALSAAPETKPHMISINLGHIVAWETAARGRTTVHFPNTYEEIAAVLMQCQHRGIIPELGVMDLGFVSNAVTLRDDRLLPTRPWFLVELDSPTYGGGRQVAPSTVENYDLIARQLREHFLTAAHAGHGNGQAGYAVIHRALMMGDHIRVGFEDAIHLPDSTLAPSNAAMVDWAVIAARQVGREPATAEETRRIIGIEP